MSLPSVRSETASRSRLKVLQALHLLALQPAELLAPPIIRHLAHPNLADGVRHGLPLRDQNIDLPQLRDDLFRLVSLPCHCSPPGCQRHTSSRTTSMGVDHWTYPFQGPRRQSFGTSKSECRMASMCRMVRDELRCHQFVMEPTHFAPFRIAGMVQNFA